MLDANAIQELSKAQAIDAANTATLATLDSKLPVVIPSDFQAVDLEQFMPLRRRARGAMATSDMDSFATYVKAHAEPGVSVFVSTDTMAANAVLNFGVPLAPGHADNRASFTVKRTAAFDALMAIANGTAQKQATIAEFLEDWAPFVACFSETDAMTLPRGIAAVRKVTIESMRTTESAERQLGATLSALEKVQASSGPDPLPTTIYFKCFPYLGLADRQFVMRLSVITNGDKPSLVLRIVKLEQHKEEMAEELAGLVRDKLGDTAPVFLGSYKAA